MGGSNKQGIFVTATDPYTSQYEAMKIENAAENLEIVKIVHFREYDPEKSEGKLVISTVPLKQKKDNEIEITKHVSQLDLNKISSYIAEYEKRKQNQKVMDTVRKTFREELIAVDVAVAAKREAIQEASNLLIRQGCLTEDVTDKVFDLEEKRPTTIGSQIAMVHVYKESVKESGIAILKMKYPIRWSETSKVKLVFFLAINYEESKEILLLLKSLYSLIDNEEIMEEILEAEGSEKIYEILMKEIG